MTSDMEIKETVNAYWDEIAGEYDDSPGHDVRDPDRRRRWSALLDAAARGATDPTAARHPAGDPPRHVLDIGCGTGFLALRLAEAGHRVTGVDQSPAMLDLARAKAAAAGVAIALVRGDADAPPVPEASMDAVTERHVLWTMPDPVATLRAWWAALRPGGRLVLVEGDWRDRPADDASRFRRRYGAIQGQLPLFGGRPAGEVTPLVTAAGYTEVASWPLDERVLWEGAGDRPTRARYLVTARRP